MKFQEAFDKIFDIEKEEVIKENPGLNIEFGIEPKTAKIIALVWNMLAVTGGNFDDLARIDKNKNVVSIPLPEEVEKYSKQVKEEESLGEEKEEEEPTGKSIPEDVLKKSGIETKKEKDTDKSSAKETIAAEGDNDSGNADA